MAFTRSDASGWHREVPGARWFKADLHIHTIDDHPGGRAKLPAGVNGPADAPDTIAAYARGFLQSAVARQVRVLGITPHTVLVGETAETSAVWRIVEEWNGGSDDDGVPFREKIYAVFPGFEPSLKQGKSGLHLLFLFDPEIGRECYIRAFNLVMGSTPSPWCGNQFQLSSRSADEAFREPPRFSRRGDQGHGFRRVELHHARTPHRQRQGSARRAKGSGAATLRAWGGGRSRARRRQVARRHGARP